MILALISLVAPQSAESASVVWTEQVAGIVVTNDDYRGCPYETVAQIKKRVPTDIFGAKGYDRLEAVGALASEARAVGADAVVFATIGTRHMSAFKWSSVNLTGRAVRFTDPACSPASAYAKARTAGPLIVPTQP